MEKLFEKYNIEKKYSVIKDRYNEPIGYSVEYITNSHSPIKFIKNSSEYMLRLNGIKANNFNKDFFDKNNIEIKVEKDKEIPLGLIGIYDNQYNRSRISIVFSSIEEIYNSKEIIENFERALYLRCEALEFIDNFEINIFEY